MVRLITAISCDPGPPPVTGNKARVETGVAVMRMIRGVAEAEAVEKTAGLVLVLVAISGVSEGSRVRTIDGAVEVGVGAKVAVEVAVSGVGVNIAVGVRVSVA